MIPSSCYQCCGGNPSFVTSFKLRLSLPTKEYCREVTRDIVTLSVTLHTWVSAETVVRYDRIHCVSANQEMPSVTHFYRKSV